MNKISLIFAFGLLILAVSAQSGTPAKGKPSAKGNTPAKGNESPKGEVPANPAKKGAEKQGTLELNRFSICIGSIGIKKKNKIKLEHKL